MLARAAAAAGLLVELAAFWSGSCVQIGSLASSIIGVVIVIGFLRNQCADAFCFGSRKSNCLAAVCSVCRVFVDVICEGGSHGRCAGASPSAYGQPFASSSCASCSVRGLSPGLCCPLVCIANPHPPIWNVQDN